MGAPNATVTLLYQTRWLSRTSGVPIPSGAGPMHPHMAYGPVGCYQFRALRWLVMPCVWFSNLFWRLQEVECIRSNSFHVPLLAAAGVNPCLTFRSVVAK